MIRLRNFGLAALLAGCTMKMNSVENLSTDNKLPSVVELGEATIERRCSNGEMPFVYHYSDSTIMEYCMEDGRMVEITPRHNPLEGYLNNLPEGVGLSDIEAPEIDEIGPSPRDYVHTTLGMYLREEVQDELDANPGCIGQIGVYEKYGFSRDEVLEELDSKCVGIYLTIIDPTNNL